ncbi:hypothetical protein ACFVKH_06680 [Almyronema epifaneia S1]|uniref:Uncharacterized protein n=2 Tax=Almyronema TaxID=3114804 RepID=A0ABW6ICP7_9CYAN
MESIPSFLILTIVTPCLAIAMVVTEFFLSNPTRYKANWKTLRRNYLPLVTLTGLISGTILGLLNWQLLSSSGSSIQVRLLSWGSIGLFTGLAESLSWSFRSVEGSGKSARNRIIQSVILGSVAGLVAATLYESLRQYLGIYQEPFGFIGLGLLLGCVLSFTSRPSYQVALRAGQGFEKIDFESDLVPQLSHKKFSSSVFNFVPLVDNRDNLVRIEEGLSIKLPAIVSKNHPIIVGSRSDADIFIPDVAPTCASLWREQSGVKLRCEFTKAVRIQQQQMRVGDIVMLRHNQILSFYHETNPAEFYRFIFYDRLLDPQA